MRLLCRWVVVEGESGWMLEVEVALVETARAAVDCPSSFTLDLALSLERLRVRGSVGAQRMFVESCVEGVRIRRKTSM